MMAMAHHQEADLTAFDRRNACLLDLNHLGSFQILAPTNNQNAVVSELCCIIATGKYFQAQSHQRSRLQELGLIGVPTCHHGEAANFSASHQEISDEGAQGFHRSCSSAQGACSKTAEVDNAGLASPESPQSLWAEF